MTGASAAGNTAAIHWLGQEVQRCMPPPKCVNSGASRPASNNKVEGMTNQHRSVLHLAHQVPPQGCHHTRTHNHSQLLHPAVGPSVPWRPASLVTTPQLPKWTRTSRRSHFIMTQCSTDAKTPHNRMALCTPGASTHSLYGRSSRSATPGHCQFPGLVEYADTSALPQEVPHPHTTTRAPPTHTPEGQLNKLGCPA